MIQKLYPISNFQIIKILKNNKFFKGCYSHDNIIKLKNNESIIINLANYKEIGTHWISIKRIDDNNKEIYFYFDSFGVQHISDKIRNFYNGDIFINIYRIQKLRSVLCGLYCMLFIEYKMKNLNDYINFLHLFNPVIKKHL